MVHDRFATLDSPRLDTWDFRGARAERWSTPILPRDFLED